MREIRYRIIFFIITEIISFNEQHNDIYGICASKSLVEKITHIKSLSICLSHIIIYMYVIVNLLFLLEISDSHLESTQKDQVFHCAFF